MHSKFIIFGDNFAKRALNLLNLADSCHVYGYMCLLSFIDVGIKTLWDLNTKRNLYEKVMAVLDYLGVHFSRIWEIFDGVGFRFEFWVRTWHFEGQSYVADERTSLRLSRGIC